METRNEKSTTIASLLPPGPYHTDGPASGLRQVRDARARLLTFTPSFDGEGGVSLAEAQAAARLFAASWELLEAARAVAEAVRKDRVYSDDPEMEQLRAAISKAVGGAL